MKLVIAYGRLRAGFHAPPGFFVAGKILFGAVRVSQIPDGHHRAGVRFEKFRRGLGSCQIRAVSDITRADQNRIVYGRLRCGLILFCAMRRDYGRPGLVPRLDGPGRRNETTHQDEHESDLFHLHPFAYDFTQSRALLTAKVVQIFS